MILLKLKGDFFMSNHYPPFVEAVKATDEELYEIITKNMDLALADGALDQKTKVMITMALDAFAGAVEGVKSLSQRARDLGATEDEIKEVLRISYMVASMKTLATTRAAYNK